jgi:hypothetical protein
MKVTSNLSFLLCISSVAMPVIDARANGFGLNKRSAVTKRSIEHRKAFDAAVVHQEHRSLQTAKEQCEAIYKEILGDVGCMCTADGEEPTEQCLDEIITFCTICDTLEGERTCYVADFEATAAVSSGDVEAECYYTSGKFDNTICMIDSLVDDSCTVTIDGTACSSCTVVACSNEEDDMNVDVDCSNVIDGETWNLCTDDIPETSRFLAFGNNDRFVTDLECSPAQSPTTAVPVSSPTTSPTKSPTSGAFALSFHALSVVGLVVVTTFW